MVTQVVGGGTLSEPSVVTTAVEERVEGCGLALLFEDQ